MRFFQGVEHIKLPDTDGKRLRDGYYFNLVDTAETGGFGYGVGNDSINLFVRKEKDSKRWEVYEPITGLAFGAHGLTRAIAVEAAAVVLHKYGVKYTKNCVDISLVAEKKEAVFNTYGFNVKYNAVPRYREIEKKIEEKRTGKYNYHRGVVEQY